jgi:type I restriction enzyme, S subunit
MESLTIDYSYAKKDDGTFRLDAEHYRKEFLTVHNRLINCGSIQLSKIISRPVMTGHTPSMKKEEYYGGTIKFIKTDNLREFNITDSFTDSLTELGNNVIKRSTLKEKDIVITIIGATYDIVGRTCLIQKKDLPANINQNIALIRVSGEIKPEFLTIYLNTYYGRRYLWFLSRQTEQVNLNCREIEQLLIPKCNPVFQDYITNLYSKSFDLIEKSKYHYHDAESSLLSEFGLSDWQPKHVLSFVRNYSETEQAGRIDAEYFQPKYDDIENAIKSYKGGYSQVKDEFKQNKSTFKVDDKETYRYVEIGSINVYSGEVQANEVLGAELPANAKRVLKKNDVVISKVRTYRGAITIIDQDGYIGSGAFTVLHEKGRINKETLLAFLHSKPLLAWSLKPNTGTSYPVIVDDDILNLPIPLISDIIQTQIQQKITESFNLRKQSKYLLECAKKAVELAIEKDEKTAMQWLQEQTQNK